METIKFQGIGTDDLDIEGPIEGVGSQYLEHTSAVFKIESKNEDKVMEVRAQKTPYWCFSIGPHKSDFVRNPQWRHSRNMQMRPIVTEILELEVPEDAVIERVQ